MKNVPDSTRTNSDSQLLLDHIRNTYEQFEEKLSELSIIRELASALLYINDFKKLCQTLLGIITRNTVAANCSIMLVDYESDRLFLAAATSPGGSSYVIDQRNIFSREGLNYTFRIGEGIAGESVAKRKPILIDDVDESESYLFLKDARVELGTILSIPLAVEESVLGVLTLSHPAKNSFHANDLNLLSIVANLVALALHSALNYQRLHYSEEKYKAVTQYSNDGIAIIQEGAHKYANPRYESLTGYSYDELKEISFNELVSAHASVMERDRHGMFHDPDLAGTYEAVMGRKSGKSSEIEISHAPFLYEGRQAEIISIRDLTERKELESRLQHAQKMEALGTLGGGIAHDFNNLLTGIRGNLSLMLMGTDTTHPFYERLKKIEKQVESGAKLTSHLLGYARKGRYEAKPTDLNRVVRETADTFGRTRRQVTIHMKLAKDLAAVHADENQIEQVLFNLYVNAADAMPKGGVLILKTANTSDGEMKGKPYDPRPGGYVRLTVTDTGTGMDKETRKRIFDPFFTTKEMGRGTGLGLATVYGIIKGHGGYIDVESEQGKGTTFTVYLPMAKGKAHKPAEAAAEVVGGSGTVLLVDDDEVIIEVAQDLLQAVGYEVLVAGNGEEAVEVYRANPERIDIVVLDMIMPIMGGGQAYDRLKEINPDIKVLLSSGYSIDGEAREIMGRGCNGFIQKPFNISDLSRRISEILKGVRLNEEEDIGCGQPPNNVDADDQASRKRGA